ncbi:MAG: hypothetical protein CM15mP130_2260 [Verrucomicrobiota bacterium]|nr:MAG: hypothetical protein CM15mP130_2260 [Verrucomicrobiota bacterium]
MAGLCLSGSNSFHQSMRPERFVIPARTSRTLRFQLTPNRLPKVNHQYANHRKGFFHPFYETLPWLTKGFIKFFIGDKGMLVTNLDFGCRFITSGPRIYKSFHRFLYPTRCPIIRSQLTGAGYPRGIGVVVTK